MPRSSRPASTCTWPTTWLAAQYRRAAEVIDAQLFADKPTAGGAW
jgi:hypothetical protein